MDIQEMLQWTGDRVLAKTGKPLDSLQRAILEGTLQGQKYPEIAKNSNVSHDYVKKVGSKLWKLLSDVLEEDIKIAQSNVRSILEKIEFSNNSHNVQICNGNINVWGENLHSPAKRRSPSAGRDNSDKVDRERCHDLRDAPELNWSCDRPQALATLKEWIIEKNTRLVTLLGLSGIGKTALAVQLVQLLQDNYDYIIWRSLENSPTRSDLQTNLMQFFSQQQATKFLSPLDYVRSHPCLIILDDVQQILASRELAGEYQPGYEDYGTFFKQVTEFPHKSCLLLLSWEKPRDIATLEAAQGKCRSFQLQGLGASGREICKERGLTDPDKWLELIHLYSGNPLWLNIVATMIIELFNGSVAEFLSCPTLCLGDVEPLLQKHCQRLSESEKQVMFWLASQEVAVEISSPPETIPLSPDDFFTAVHSLRRRCLIDKVAANGRSGFTLQPVIKEYVKHQSWARSN
ncbi:MAG: ATPase [Hormoscilla sp. GUM202]|nr:ATPase [Hormoscilla sp. GUM202]